MAAANIDDTGLGLLPWQGAQSIILGCGNVLLGDDGFGPNVIRYIEENLEVPPEVRVLDAATGVRLILFDFLDGEKPEKIVIVDAIDREREPGEVFEIQLDELGPILRADDYATHLGPTSNLLFGLRENRGIEIRIVACQISETSDEICTPMSAAVTAAVPVGAEMALKLAELED